MAMTLYEEAFGPLAKRPRVDYNTNSLERLGYPFLLPPQLVEIQLAKKPVEEHPNHVPVENPSGKFPYIMKLCFSSSKAIPVIIH